MFHAEDSNCQRSITRSPLWSEGNMIRAYGGYELQGLALCIRVIVVH
jgi:hypothetical protein